jgi:alpha-tubulin suppressor-like RCC1 family protein
MVVSLMVFIPASVSHAAIATSYDAQQGSVQAIARDGGNVEFSITTWLPNAQTLTADSVFVYDPYAANKVLGVATSPRIVLLNGQTYANYHLSIPVASFVTFSYGWNEKYQTPTGLKTYNRITTSVGITNLSPPAVASSLSDWQFFSNPNSYKALASYMNVPIVGEPVDATFGPATPDPFQTFTPANNQTYGVSLVDKNGMPTVMLPGTSLTITPTSNMSLQASPSSSTYTSAGQLATISANDINARLEYSILGTRDQGSPSTVALTPMNDWATIPQTSFTIPAVIQANASTTPSVSSIQQVGVGQNGGSFALEYALLGGSDGNLYFFGFSGQTQQTSQILTQTFQNNTVNVAGPGNYSVQPIKVTIPSGCFVKQIVNSQVLDSCGYLWATSLQVLPSSKYPSTTDTNSPANIGLGVASNFKLVRLPAPNAGDHRILQISDSGSYALLDDHTVLNLNPDNGNPLGRVDLSNMGSDTPTSITYSSSANTLYILGASGKLYSDYSNSYGSAGVGSNAASIPLSPITFPNEPDSAKVQSVATASGATVALLSDGTLWSWGYNANGQAGKDSSQISQLNAPALVPVPNGATVSRVASEFAPYANMGNSLQIYLKNGSNQNQIYHFVNGNWNEIRPPSESGSLVQAVIGGTYWMTQYFYVDESGEVFSVGLTGNCGDTTTSRITSTGQFGPAYSYDSLIISSTYLQEGNNVTTVIGNALNETAGHQFSLQISGVHTRCYADPSQLTFAWDLEGTGSYTTPTGLTVANTGYLVIQTPLQYSAAGRYKVGLQATTPAGSSFRVVTSIGIDAETSETLPVSETRTVTTSNSGSHTLAIATDSNVYAWGTNRCDNLGVSKSTYTSISLPIQVPFTDTDTVATVTAGYNTSYIVDSAGKVFAWGSSPGPNGRYAGIIPTLVSELASTPIRDVAASIGSNYECNAADISPSANKDYSPTYTTALTSTGHLIYWSTQTGIASIPGAAGLLFKQILTSSNKLYALDVTGQVWTWSGGANALVQSPGISDVASLRGGNQSVIAMLKNGNIYGEYSNNLFHAISSPNNISLVDAQPGPYQQVYGISNTGTIYSSSISYDYVGVNKEEVLRNSTWIPVAHQVATSESDMPVTQPKTDSYIAFNSGRLGYIGGYANSGSCGLTWAPINRVISTGQFGNAYNPDQISVGSLTATVGTQATQNINQGSLIAAKAGTPVIIRAQNISSQCFGSNLTIATDNTGDGSYSTVPLSNENGTFNYVVSAIVPSSGRLSVSIRASAISGLSLTFTVNLASFASTDYENIVPRSESFYTNRAFGMAVGGDGHAYGWANNKTFNLMLNSNAPFASAYPTKIILPGSPTIVDVAGATSYSSDGQDFGVLIADATGKVWSWANSEISNLPITTAISGSTPTSPTAVPGLVGVKIARLAVSSSGNSMAALASTGVVYLWNQEYRTPTPITALAGLNIVDIHVDDENLYAQTSSGDLYTSGGTPSSGWQANSSKCTSTPAGTNLSDISQSCFPMQKVNIGAPVKNFTSYNPNYGTLRGVTAVTTTGKLFYWGYFNGAYIATPAEITLPDSLTPALTSNGFKLPQVITTNGTWLSLTSLANNNPSLVRTNQFLPFIETQAPNVAGVSEGDGGGIKLANNVLFTSPNSTPGSCSINQAWFNQVMSDGQFGVDYHTDSVNLSASGPNLFRPGVASPISLTASSVCNGGLDITFDHEVLGESGFSGNTAGTPSYNQASSTAVFNFTPTTNGVNWITFRATNSHGISGTYQFEADVVPAPPAGRLIGVSIQKGSRYTNTRNVNIDMVWPDGTLVAYISNDGGFEPGTYSQVPLQTEIPWVLPPQAVVPLPAIIYARFGNENALTYFDDIIMDSNPPILTYVSATPTP